MIRIDVLPDDVLLGIFDLYLDMSVSYGEKTTVEEWHSLVHVCRRWRSLVFRSPRRLNLQLFCTPETPARDTLDVWPALPLIVRGNMASSGTDNIIAVLGQSNRVSEVYLWGLAGWQLEEVLAAMQVPFPEMIDMRLIISDGETVPVIPDSFLDGSAPRLQYFELSGIPFPGLPKLLLSANRLVYLWIADIPDSGYISPEALVALLCALSSLETLILKFRSPQSRPDQESRSLPPPKRSVIPTLSHFRFKGVVEYLEDIVASIDAFQLNTLHITFFNQIDFDTPRLAEFINRTPRLRKRHAHVQFDDNFARVGLRYWESKSDLDNLLISISCREPDWQLSSIEQVCNFSLHSLFNYEALYIEHRYSQLVWKNDAIENTLWLQLLLPFTGVKNLYLSEEFAPGIVAVLQELVGDRILEVLPSLQNIFVEGLRVEPSVPWQENIWQFAAARRHSSHPIAISVWM